MLAGVTAAVNRNRRNGGNCGGTKSTTFDAVRIINRLPPISAIPVQ